MAQRNLSRSKGIRQAVLLDDRDFLRTMVEELLQEFLEQEMKRHLEAESYERTAKRKGYRNGYKPRQLKTRVGTLNLLIPQDREGKFKTELFERYQRSEKALTLSLMEMYLQGVSTRKVKKITELLCGTSFSKSQVSNLAMQLDKELGAWRQRPLNTEYPYITVDARYEYLRVNKQVINQSVLIVCGIRSDGKREVLAVDVANSESEASYQELFRSLKERGLRGVRLVSSDEHKGLKAAIRRHFQAATWQRCQVHYLRNQLGKLSYKNRKSMAADLKQIFNAPSYDWAKRITESVVERYYKTMPKFAEQLDESIEDCLAAYHFPESHRKRIRSTNGLERLNQEINRRTKVVRIFPNRESCLRLLTALCVEQSEEWLSGRVYLDMSLLKEKTKKIKTSQERKNKNRKELNLDLVS